MGSKDEFSYEDRGSGRELGTPKQRDAFVRKLRRNKMFLGEKQFKEFIKSRYAEVNLSQIMLAYSKVVVAPMRAEEACSISIVTFSGETLYKNTDVSSTIELLSLVMQHRQENSVIKLLNGHNFVCKNLSLIHI